MLVDRALRALFSVGTGAVSGLLRWGSQRLSDRLSGQPAQLRTTVADVVIGEARSEGQQQTIAFGLDGQAYEIDLDADHATELRSTLQRYIDAGRRIGEQPTAPATQSVRPRRSAATAQQDDPAAIRAWARAHGHQVSGRGRIPATILEAYEAAQRRSRRTG